LRSPASGFRLVPHLYKVPIPSKMGLTRAFLGLRFPPHSSQQSSQQEAGSMAKNLIRKGNGLYCRVAIPRPLRQHFLSEAGKPRDAIWETLGPDLCVAKPKCAARVAYWESVFARLRAGQTLADIKADDELANPKIELVPLILSADEAVAMRESLERWRESQRRRQAFAPTIQPLAPVPEPAEPSASETVSQAADALYGALERDKRRQTTVDGHRL